MQAIESSSSPPSGGNLPAIMPGSAIDFSTLSPTTPVCLKSAGREYRITANDIVQWVAPGAPPIEAAKLLVVAQNVGLNPLLKEIELLEIRGAWHIYVRKQGLIKAAQRYPEYDGHETGIVVVDIAEKMTPFDVAGAIIPPGHKVVGGWAKVYRKGLSRPIYKRIALKNYARDKGIWQDNPNVMCEKVALAQALREAFPLGEVYDEAELPGVQRAAELSADQPGQPDSSPLASWVASLPDPALAPGPGSPVVLEPELIEAEVIATAAPTTATTAAPTTARNEPFIPEIPADEPIDVEALEPHERPCSEAQQAEIADLVQRAGFTPGQLAKILAKRGVESADQLTVFQATEIICKLAEKVSAMEFSP